MFVCLFICHSCLYKLCFCSFCLAANGFAKTFAFNTAVLFEASVRFLVLCFSGVHTSDFVFFSIGTIAVFLFSLSIVIFGYVFCRIFNARHSFLGVFFTNFSVIHWSLYSCTVDSNSYPLFILYYMRLEHNYRNFSIPLSSKIDVTSHIFICLFIHSNLIVRKWA